MRRPIFGNGLPRRIVLADGLVEIFDTKDLDPSQVYAVTLFMWIYQAGPGPFTNPAVAVTCVTQGGAPALLSGLAPTYLNSFFGGINPTRIEPIKALDRVMVRGDQQIFAQVTVDGSAPGAVFWGYFEMAGEQDVGTPFRGLQPDKPVTPFVFAPIFQSFATGEDGDEVVHRLDPNYVDLLTIDLAHAGAADVSLDWHCEIVFPNGTEVFMPSLDVTSVNAFRHRVLDGIPMLALDATDNGKSVLVGGATGAGGFSSFVSSYGSFVRG